MELSSDRFHDGEYIPEHHAYGKKNISPGLRWSDVPGGTEGFVLIMDDPDAPGGTWTHWVAYNIPKNARSLEENIPPEGTLDSGTRQGINSFGEIGYGGPWPPPGPVHRYIFTLYALKETPDIDPGASKKEVIYQIKHSIIEEAQLVGQFSR